MTLLARALLVLALAAWFTLPSVGDDGGENAGGTGVWILPRSNFLSQSSADCEQAPREGRVFTNLSQNILLALSPEMGAATATLIDEILGEPIPLPVTGALVCLPANLLQAMGSAGVTDATIVVTDASHAGYVILLKFDAAGTGVSIQVL